MDFYREVKITNNNTIDEQMFTETQAYKFMHMVQRDGVITGNSTAPIILNEENLEFVYEHTAKKHALYVYAGGYKFEHPVYGKAVYSYPQKIYKAGEKKPFWKAEITKVKDNVYYDLCMEEL